MASFLQAQRKTYKRQGGDLWLAQSLSLSLSGLEPGPGLSRRLALPSL